MKLYNWDKEDIEDFETAKLTVLTIASCFGTKEIVELLIDHFKVDITETGFLYSNCFLTAVLGGKIETMKYLHSIDDKLVNTSSPKPPISPILVIF